LMLLMFENVWGEMMLMMINPRVVPFSTPAPPCGVLLVYVTKGPFPNQITPSKGLNAPSTSLPEIIMLQC
jgi:hypothetical protein